MKPLVIGLAGQAGCDKDTFADHLRTHYGFAKTSFAYPLKHCVKYLFKMTDEQMTDRELKELSDIRYGLSPRDIMQLFATEFVRKMVHVNFWVNRMREDFEDSKFERIVIADVRFPNEAKLIRQYGTLIHINRPDNPLAIDSTHESEHPLLLHTGDITIDNRDLKRSLWKFTEAIKSRYWKELAENTPKNEF